LVVVTEREYEMNLETEFRLLAVFKFSSSGGKPPKKKPEVKPLSKD
jgi:hypothetical protein